MLRKEILREEQLIFKLKNDWKQNTPDVWEQIRSKLAAKIADELLLALDGIPSPQGRLFAEYRDAAIEQSCEQEWIRGA